MAKSSQDLRADLAKISDGLRKTPPHFGAPSPDPATRLRTELSNLAAENKQLRSSLLDLVQVVEQMLLADPAVPSTEEIEDRG